MFAAEVGSHPASREQFLVERARHRDWEAFEELVACHRFSIWRLALETLDDRAAAEQVLQDTFVAAWEKLPEHRTQEPVSSWLVKLCAPFLLRRIRATVKGHPSRRIRPLPRPKPSRLSGFAVVVVLALAGFVPATAHADPETVYTRSVTVNPVELFSGTFNLEYEQAVQPALSLYGGLNYLYFQGVWRADSTASTVMGPEVGLRLYLIGDAPAGWGPTWARPTFTTAAAQARTRSGMAWGRWPAST